MGYQHTIFGRKIYLFREARIHFGTTPKNKSRRLQKVMFGVFWEPILALQHNSIVIVNNDRLSIVGIKSSHVFGMVVVVRRQILGINLVSLISSERKGAQVYFSFGKIFFLYIFLYIYT